MLNMESVNCTFLALTLHPLHLNKSKKQLNLLKIIPTEDTPFTVHHLSLFIVSADSSRQVFIFGFWFCLLVMRVQFIVKQAKDDPPLLWWHTWWKNIVSLHNKLCVSFWKNDLKCHVIFGEEKFSSNGPKNTTSQQTLESA